MFVVAAKDRNIVIRNCVALQNGQDSNLNTEIFIPPNCYSYFMQNVKQSRYRPGVVQRAPGSFPDYMTTARDGGKVVSPTHRPPLPPGNTPSSHFC